MSDEEAKRMIATLLIIRDIAGKRDNYNLEDSERLQVISALAEELFGETRPAAKAEADIVLAKIAEARTARAISRSGTRSTRG